MRQPGIAMIYSSAWDTMCAPALRHLLHKMEIDFPSGLRKYNIVSFIKRIVCRIFIHNRIYASPKMLITILCMIDLRPPCSGKSEVTILLQNIFNYNLKKKKVA